MCTLQWLILDWDLFGVELMEINPEFPLYHSKQRKMCVKINSSPICWCNESTQKELLIRFSRTKAVSSGAKTLTTLLTLKSFFSPLADRFHLRFRQENDSRKSLFMLQRTQDENSIMRYQQKGNFCLPFTTAHERFFRCCTKKKQTLKK